MGRFACLLSGFDSVMCDIKGKFGGQLKAEEVKKPQMIVKRTLIFQL